ncbi:site-specific DNA-methyltransferase [Francisella philomiragia]|uniref:site-specific DNA-methyltransferase n=1 Tax=Francisella philomiragia TaxID=28110 RepID=UPI001F1BA9FF|nr:site-specific DNA-methyltransferase [Francisella philomiragia]MBK2025843.1 site-specific DNA-methyltransferase [Francisella philomiragia]
MKKEKINDNSKITSNSNQLEILKKNFPQCFDKDGNFLSEKLNEIVKSSGADISKESYGMSWLGKSYARLLANENPLTLITEDSEHNSKEENRSSQNMLIKGDNLEVLKHLKNAYSESVKMIYIDPPYNTGGDGFVYSDDRKFTKEQLSELAGISIEDSQRILEFTNSKSNSHSAWLTFMYPRLYIARELLKDDGVIFISIDDNEASQLKMLCDEIFGEENFVGSVVWKNKYGAGAKTKGFIEVHEYVLCYSKSNIINVSSKLSGDQKKAYNKKDNKYASRGGYFTQPLMTTSMDDRKNLQYHIEYNGEVIYPIKQWVWGKERLLEAIDNDEVVFNKKADGSYSVRYKVYLVDELGNERKGKPLSLLNGPFNQEGTKEVEQLLGSGIFSFPKPTSLIEFFLGFEVNDMADNSGIYLDFFSGSGTTAHAVMQLNAEDGGKRKYILAQLDEPIDEKKEAYKFCKDNGFEPVISSITQERLIRAAKKIKTDIQAEFEAEKSKKKPNQEKLNELSKKQENIKAQDFGFKVFETRPLIDGLMDVVENYDEEYTQSDAIENLSGEDLQAILTTYKVYDGALLNTDFTEVQLDNYKAYMVEDKIYFISKGFTTSALKAFIEKVDTDKSFKPTKLVIFGYNFDSKHQREIKEAITTYTNKKSIEIDMVVRY